MKEVTQKSNVSNELATEPISKLLGRFFWPTFFASILASINDIVDRMYIGQGIGEDALSGVIVVFPILLGIMAFVVLTTTGAAVKIATSLREKNNASAELTLGNSTVINGAIGCIALLLILCAKEKLLKLLGVSDASFSYANKYLSVIAVSWSILPLGANFLGIARSEGNVKMAMYAASVAILLNIIFDPIFIFGLKMGVRGAALASVISSTFTFIWGLYHFTSKHSTIRLRLGSIKPNFSLIFEMIKLGTAPFSMAISMSLVQGVVNIQLLRYGGNLAVGVLGVIMSIMSLLMYVVRSLASSAQPIISYNYGAKNYGRINKTILYLLWISSIISCIAFVLVMLFPSFLVTLFSKGSRPFLELGVTGLRLSSIALPLYGVMMIGSQYFIAVGQIGKATVLNLLQQVLLYLPALFILGSYLGLDGIWLANSISMGIAAFIISFFIFKEYRSLQLKAVKEARRET